MKLFKKDLMQGLKVVVLAFILSVGVSYVFADWTPPLSTPPNCVAGNPGCDAPIHVGLPGQEKKGGLIVGGFRSKLLAIFDTQVQIKGGNPADKKILASDGTGLASWKFPSELDIVNSNDPETICRTLGGTWASAKCNFPGGGSNSNAQTICTTLGGVWNATTLRCAFNGGSGNPGGGITSIVSGTTNTINVATSGTTVTLNANMQKVCEALGGVWNTSNSTCSGIGSTSSSGVSSVSGGTNISVTSTGANGTGNVTVSTNMVTLCQSLGGTWNGTVCTGIGGNVSVTEFGPYSRLNKTSIGVHTYCAISRISTSLENHGARVWKEGNEWFVASISAGGEMPGYSDSSLQRFNVTCFSGVVSGGSTGGSGVTKINAGTGISVSPESGTGEVTITATGSASVGAVAIGGGGWEGSTNINNLGCITQCDAWGGASCSATSCSRFVSCPSGYTKVMTGSYEQSSDIPNHHRPHGFASTRRSTGFICYK